MLEQKLQRHNDFLKRTNIFSYISVAISLIFIGLMYYFWNKVDPDYKDLFLTIKNDIKIGFFLGAIILFAGAFIFCGIVNLVNKIWMLSILLKSDLDFDIKKVKIAFGLNILFALLTNILLVIILDWHIYWLVKDIIAKLENKKNPYTIVSDKV
ncbi:hypothetical protein [Metamycoplasma canadense]|uniref:hypothetical protein n=1 Tax=Metamycoplasma canadense TaxID=29554 RepID=UPI0005EDED32|nr:hypothetical protein [Metamycoplasma canadense]